MNRSRRTASLWAAWLLTAALASCAAERAPTTTPAPLQIRGNSDEKTTPAKRVVVQQGETLYTIAKRYEVPVRTLIEANNLAPPYTVEPGASLNVPAQRRHAALPGETIYNVARRYGVDISSLARLNSLPPPYTLHTGQSLLLPAPVQQVAAVPNDGRTPAPVEYRAARPTPDPLPVAVARASPQ